MTNQTDPFKNAGEIIEAFLQQTPAPTFAQWGELAQRHGDIAAEIADAALLFTDAQHMNEEDLLSPLDEELFNTSVSAAVNRVHAMSSPLFEEMDRKLDNLRGAGVKAAAVQFGLGLAPALLSGVLAGTIQGPRRVLHVLAERINVDLASIRSFFQWKYSHAPVPAFRAEHGKPTLSAGPTPWAEAVSTYKFSESDMQALLELDE